MKINLVYASDARYGGHVTFTAHLCRALRSAGAEVTLYKIGKKETNRKQEFGYAEYCYSATLKQLSAMMRVEPTLITASNKPLVNDINYLIERGARMVVHDPSELTKGYDIDRLQRPIIIRKTMLKLLKGAKFIPHPYDPLFNGIEFHSDSFNKRKYAVSISRIDFDKNSTILLDANRLLPKSKQIHIVGFENRIYTRFNILPKYPEWEQSIAHYPRELRYAVEKCSKYKAMVDMSTIKYDGGGTQYTFLEAIDAGCILLLNRNWLIKGGTFVEDENCLAAATGKELAAQIKNIDATWYAHEIVEKSKGILENHEPKKVGRAYLKELA